MKGDILTESILQIVGESYDPKFERLKAEIEALKNENKFFSYPKGIQEYFGCSYDKARRIWLKKDFPRQVKKFEDVEIKGAYARDIENFLRGL